MTNIVLLTSHAIAEHDDLDMFTRMGLPVYSIGGAYDEVPFEGKRPAIPGVIRYPELEAATDRRRAQLAEVLGDPGDNIDWAKARLAPEVAEWADVVIVHHFPEQWIGGNWNALQGKRVIWRTCGQSDPRLEREMTFFRDKGLEIVRYSPRERQYFGEIGSFAGEDACIRFGKDANEWTGWEGSEPVIGNITQHMRQRGDACGYDFWEAATRNLPARPAGPGSEIMAGGIGSLSYSEMRAYLRYIRAYLYTGTRPASYTLGLIEAMMTGTPVVTMGPGAFHPSELFEAHEIARLWDDDPDEVADLLRRMLADEDFAAEYGKMCRERAIDLFGLQGVMAQWWEYLGVDA